MSVTRTFTVTVQSTGSGNKYFIDGVQTPTLTLGEGGTYKFDQSDSTNGTHPLRFATAADAAGGTQYTTGVTTNGTPGNSGAYTQIVVAASAPTLYYYCTNHGGMGGQANTVDGNSWGIFPWGVNEYGDQDSIDITLTGVSATSSVGSVEAFNKEGWGRQEWGNSGWGVDYAVQPTGLSTTTSLGSVTTEIAVPLTGLSTTSSLGTPTLDLTSIVIPTGQQAQTQLGDFDNAGTLVGWGRNGWGEEPYGDSFNKLVQLSGLTTLNSSVGSLTLDLQTIVTPTGLSATSSVGSLSLVIDSTPVITGVSATSNVGSISPADVMGLTGVSATSSVGGLILDALTEQPTGQEATTAVGDLTVEIGIPLTGVSTTSSVGSLVPEIGVPLTGVSATSTTGTITPESFVVGLTGQLATSSVGIPSPLYTRDLTYNTSASYTIQTNNKSASYSNKTNNTSASYTDKSHAG